MVYTANWVIIYHLPPIKGTRFHSIDWRVLLQVLFLPSPIIMEVEHGPLGPWEDEFPFKFQVIFHFHDSWKKKGTFWMNLLDVAWRVWKVLDVALRHVNKGNCLFVFLRISLISLQQAQRLICIFYSVGNALIRYSYSILLTSPWQPVNSLSKFCVKNPPVINYHKRQSKHKWHLKWAWPWAN